MTSGLPRCDPQSQAASAELVRVADLEIVVFRHDPVGAMRAQPKEISQS
jgi:hypothetical protein